MARRILKGVPSMGRDADCLVIFPSSLGWIALQGRGAALKQLSFGQPSPDAALGRLDPMLAAGASVARWNPELIERLQAYADGARDDFRNVQLDLGPQTEFQRRVVARCRAIGYGDVMTYGELALAAGSPRAARAVGNVMRTNRIPLIVPCHRVIGSGGGMCGYSAGEGVRMKLRLLELEGVAKTSAKGPKRRAFARSAQNPA
jgi:methylated-DNA-[protein]-cysteine S-methyltransferase